jgi:SagB-type dehydrogenase family enzyme
VSAPTPTAEFASLVYGDAGASLDDAAEAFHEASSLYPGVAPHRLQTIVELTRNPALQETVARASFTREHLPPVDLPAEALGEMRFGDVLAARASRRPAAPAMLPLGAVSTVAGAAYRAANGRRPVPSGGALYPLELYICAVAVDGVEPGAYHYHPYRHRLHRLRAIERSDMRRCLVDDELGDRLAALLVITGMFWRARFKYGLRGYRFALLEAGHVMQNAVLAAAALGVPAVPLGGFFDREVDGLVGADSLNEASLYVLALGGAA